MFVLEHRVGTCLGPTTDKSSSSLLNTSLNSVDAVAEVLGSATSRSAIVQSEQSVQPESVKQANY